jgi:hypothetical protein
VALSFQLSSHNTVPNEFPKKIRVHAAVLIALAVGIVIGAALPSPLAERHVAQVAAAPTVALTPSTVEPSTTPSTEAPTTTASPPPEPPATAPPAPRPAFVPALPTGKGMWIWQPEYVEQGDAPSIVARAQANGLTHLYVRMGSSVDGFTGGPFLDALLPVAHAGGIRIIGWDFPYLDDVQVDVDRALQAIHYVTPTGDRIDAFSADIETPFEYVALTAYSAQEYGTWLREGVGSTYPLIATVPRPSPGRQVDYPYPEVTWHFDAIAPMVYWIDQPSDEEAANAVDYLSQFGKPVLPIGQAYDGGLEGGPPGTPTADEISAFINAADAHGAAGVSFWSWQHASDEMWGAIGAAQEVGVKPTG